MKTIMPTLGGKVLLASDIYAPVSYVPYKGCKTEEMERGVLISWDNQTARVLYCETRTIQKTNLSDLVWG